MGRDYRWFIDREHSSYHIISRVSRGEFLLDDEGKEYFMNLMFKLAKAYYVDITSFAIMSNHFHILLSNRKDEVAKATKDELFSRYKKAYGDNAEPPEGSFIKRSFEIDYDEDGGVERLRQRLGSVSRFVQELKQGFTKWYNYKNNCKGVLWGDRFKGIAISKGDAELICSAYVDLNPVRAGIVKKPEDYRWSSIGLRVRNAKKAKKILTVIQIEKPHIKIIKDSGIGKDENYKRIKEWKKEEVSFSVYRAFVYDSGKVKKEGAGSISEQAYKESKSIMKRLGISDILSYKYRNITEGLAFGSYKIVADFQEKFNRKFIKPRKVIINEEDREVFYSTRNLKGI
jgi:REP element-mobilizing transposase RayT